MSAPLSVGLAALSASVASFAALRVAWALPTRWIGLRATVRASFGAGLVAYCLAAAAIPLASVLGYPTESAERIGASFAFVFATLLGASVATRRRHERAALRLIEILPSSQSPAYVHAALVERLARLRASHRPEEPTCLAALEVAAVRAMRLSGLREPCERLASTISTEKLSPPLRDALLYDRALLRLREGDFEGAEPLLDDADQGPRRSLRALAHALQGGADQALALLDASRPTEPEPRLLAGVARGHALASMGREDETRELLRSLVAEHGVSAFTHLLRPVGPATDIARSLLGRPSLTPAARTSS